MSRATERPAAAIASGPIRLVAGSAGPERRPPRPDPAEPRWYEPPHVRDAAGARDRIAAIVAAGADLVIAPTWLTHRRALLPIGETRRARAWTASAVRVARDGIEIGLERRERGGERVNGRQADPQADPGRNAEPGTAIPRLPVIVAGWLPPLDGAPEPDSGRLAPTDVAAARDLRSQAGLLAEAGVGLLVAEVAGGLEGARRAAEAGAELGLETWVAGRIGGTAAAPSFPGGTDPEAWAEVVVHARAAAILLDGPEEAAVAAMARIAAALPIPVGVVGTDGTATGRALAAGARHVGALDGATPTTIAAIRAALDAQEGERRADAARAAAAWTAIVAAAALRAPGGAAVWVVADDGDGAPARHGRMGPATERPPMPRGFAWIEVPEAAAGALPDARFRFIVADGTDTAGRCFRLGRAIEPGGILLVRVDGEVAAAVVAGASDRGLQVLDLAAAGTRVAVTLRREG